MAANNEVGTLGTREATAHLVDGYERPIKSLERLQEIEQRKKTSAVYKAQQERLKAFWIANGLTAEQAEATLKDHEDRQTRKVAERIVKESNKQ